MQTHVAPSRSFDHVLYALEAGLIRDERASDPLAWLRALRREVRETIVMLSAVVERERAWGYADQIAETAPRYMDVAVELQDRADRAIEELRQIADRLDTGDVMHDLPAIESKLRALVRVIRVRERAARRVLQDSFNVDLGTP